MGFSHVGLPVGDWMRRNHKLTDEANQTDVYILYINSASSRLMI